MIRDITIGRYFDSESVIHRMDPRTKLMGAIVYIISLFLVVVSFMSGSHINIIQNSESSFWIFVKRTERNYLTFVVYFFI